MVQVRLGMLLCYFFLWVVDIYIFFCFQRLEVFLGNLEFICFGIRGGLWEMVGGGFMGLNKVDVLGYWGWGVVRRQEGIRGFGGIVFYVYWGKLFDFFLQVGDMYDLD